MNRTTPVVLLALLVVLGGYVVFFEIREETRFLTEAELEQRKGRVFDVERSAAVTKSIRELTITREGETIAFSRLDENAWRITRPVTAVARTGLVNSLLGGLLFSRKVGDDIPPSAFPPQGLAAYGLDKPKLVISMKTGEGTEAKDYTLRLGNLDPTKQYIYAQRPADEGVMLMEKDVVGLLPKSVHDFREPKFVGFDREKVTAFRLRSREADVSLEKTGEVWMVTQPHRDRADSLRLEDVLRTIGGIEAKSYPAEAVGNLTPFGLDRPSVEFSFTRDDATTTTLLIGKPADEPVGTVYAKLADEPAIYTISDEGLGKLTFPVRFLRDRRLARLATSNVTEFSIEGDGRKLRIRKVANTWKVVEPVEIEAEEDAVDGFIRELSGLEIIRFPNDKPDEGALTRFRLDEKSRFTVTVKVKDKPDEVYTVGRIDPVNKDLYVRRNLSESVYTVRETFRKRVTGTYLDFRRRRVAEMSRHDMTRLVIHRPGGGITLAKATADKWRLTAPVLAPADDQGVDNLLEQLNDLEAVKFIAEKVSSPAEYGLDKPAYEVTIEFKPGKDKPAETRALLIGKDMKEDGFAAKLKHDDLVFTVSPTLVERLREEFRRRLVWEIKRRDVSAIVWKSASQKVSVRREEGLWKLIEPAGGRLDSMHVSEILAVVDYIRVARFEDYTRENLARYGLNTPRLTLTLTVEDVDRTLSVGRGKDKDRAYVMTSDVDAVFTLSASDVKTLLRKPLAAPVVK